MLSLQLPIPRPINFNFPSHHRKIIDGINHFAESCNPNSSLLRFRLAWGSKCAAAANDKEKDHIQLPGDPKPELMPKHVSPIMDGSRRWATNRWLPVQHGYRASGHALKQLAVNCSKSAAEGMVNMNKTKSDDSRTAFLGVYSVLKSELLNDPAFEWTNDSRLWVEQKLDYNKPGGKFNRGLSVVDTYKLLEKVGKIAVNGGLLLRNHIHRILKKHFREKPYYVDLLDLFNEVEFQTASGQMIDVITTIEGEKDLSKYSMDLHRRICQYKSAYNTFHLPVAGAFLMAGENPDDHVNAKDVLIDMGIYSQVVDDYLDCFGDPEKVGKIGTDIQDFKCSWLVLKALELCDEEQKKILYEHYGKADPTDVAKVNAIYNDINLRGVFAAYKSEKYEKTKKVVLKLIPAKQCRQSG